MKDYITSKNVRLTYSWKDNATGAVYTGNIEGNLFSNGMFSGFGQDKPESKEYQGRVWTAVGQVFLHQKKHAQAKYIKLLDLRLNNLLTGDEYHLHAQRQKSRLDADVFDFPEREIPTSIAKIEKLEIVIKQAHRTQ